MDVRSYIEENSAAFFGELKQWLRIPSISADPARHADVRASADWLAQCILKAEPRSGGPNCPLSRLAPWQLPQFAS